MPAHSTCRCVRLNTLIVMRVPRPCFIAPSLQQLIAPFLNLMPLLQSLLTQACKQGFKSKAIAIKCFKEKTNSSPLNKWHNILLFGIAISNPFTPFFSPHWGTLINNLIKISTIFQPSPMGLLLHSPKIKLLSIETDSYLKFLRNIHK